MLSSQEKRKRIQKLNFFRLGFFLIIFSFLITALFVIKGLFITLLLAFILSFVLLPPVHWLNRWGLSRPLAVPLVFFSFLGGLGALIIKSLPFLSNQFRGLQEEFPSYIEQISILMKNWQDHLTNQFFFLKNFELSETVTTIFSSLGETFFRGSALNFNSIFYHFTISPLFCLFYDEESIWLD